ncbi:MAG: CopG family antitoxin [bacterium]
MALPRIKSNTKTSNTRTARLKVRDPIPTHFESLEAAAEFWDAHDLTDYLDEFLEVKNVTVDLTSKQLRLEEELAKKIAQVARRRGVSSETLINLWLQQKLMENSKRVKRNRKASDRIAASR